MFPEKKNRYFLYGISLVFLVLLGSTNIDSTNALTVGQPPTNLIANTVSSSEIDLSWTAPSDSSIMILSGYMIERSTDNGTTWSTIVANTGNTATTYSDAGLAHSTTYAYRVSVIHALGTSPPSNTASAKTFNVVPTAPTGLTATTSNAQVSLSWTASTDNGGSTVTNYKIYRSTSSGTETILATAGNVLSYIDTTVTSGQKYFYKVTAVNSVGESSQSNEASATPAAPSSAPQPPTGLIATTVSASQINLSWTAPSDNGGSPITGYKIERSTDGGTTWSTIVANTGNTATTYSNAGLAHSTTYAYRVSAINSIGTSTPSSIASAKTLDVAPAAPTGLTATAVSESQINLSWTTPTNNGGSAVTGYMIERSTDGGTTWSTIVANTGNTATTYSNTGLATSTTYAYRVSAINSIGTSSPSNTASATTNSAVTAPHPPTGLTATTVSASQINLSWTAPSDTGSLLLTGYRIERSVDNGTTWSTIVANTGNTATTYSNTGLATSTTYAYRVSAINSIGTSSPSNTASATTNSAGDTTPPVITLKGSNPLTMGRGSIYIDPGATATDPDDGDLTSSIKTQNSVNSNTIGTYTVTYNVKDPAGNAATQVTRTVKVIDTSPAIAMNDSTSTWGLSVFSGRPIQAEFVSSSSYLVGKSIDTIIVKLQRLGLPSGTVQVGVFNNDLSVKQLFGTIDAANVEGSYTPYTFSLPTFQTYQIQPGDRIGIKFTGGDTANQVNIMTDQNDTFDGINSYLTYYVGQWLSFEGQDLTLVLERTVIPTDLPMVTPPANILSVTANSSRNIPNLGTAIAVDISDPSPAISNNSTVAFNVGVANILWRATDSKGNIGAAVQKVTVITAPPAPASQYNRVVMVNFDDGYESIFTLGKPVLDKYNIKTTQYIICGAVEKGDYMNWNMIHAMQADGQDIQAHTMDHLHSNHFSQSQLDYEFGKTPSCLANNGTSGVHMMALPYDEGYTNATVINAEAKYYDMARGGTERTFFLHCNNPSTTTQTDCRTFDSQGKLNQYNRYNIRAYYTDGDQINDNYTDTQSFAKFIQEVGSATTNTNANSTELPIVFFHRVVVDNSQIPNPAHKGTTTILLDAEMKYLRDNNFKIWTTKNLAYDPVKNWFYFKGS